MTPLELIAVFLVSIGLTLFLMCFTAPEGWQDENGFHLGHRNRETFHGGDND